MIMNDTLNSNLWPNFQTPRQSLTDKFSIVAMSAWQQNASPTASTAGTAVEDYNNVWCAKTEHNEHSEKVDFIKSIWSTNIAPLSPSSTIDSGNLATGVLGGAVTEAQKHVDTTPTNSPSLKRIEIINSNDRWGNVKINQITPWSVVEIEDNEKRPHDPMVWRAKIDGTEVWEDYYLKQHGRRRPQTENTFSGDNVWSTASEISQSTTSLWSAKINDANVPPSDLFTPHPCNEVNNRSNFSTTNGVRPSMTRNQAQKYLIDMGYSLSDAIGALVNNQMDLPKAINELQSKYRMSTNVPSVPPNGMYTSNLSLNNRTGDNINMTRIAPGTPVNSMIGQNNSNINQMIGSTFTNNYDMFHQRESTEQILESQQYMGMDPNISSHFGRMQEAKRQNSMPMHRENPFRNTFPGNSAMNTRAMSTNNSGQFGDMNMLSQEINRMNFNGPPSGHGMLSGHQQNSPFNNNNNNNNNNKWPNNMNNGAVHNVNNMMLNNNTGNMDLRQNFSPAMAVGAAGTFGGRSISKQQQIYQRNPSSMGWHSDVSSLSPNGALNDINQVRLAKTMSCSGLPEPVVGIIIKKVLHPHIELIKSICQNSEAMTHFQLQPHIQSIIVHFNSASEAHRCMTFIQSQLNLRVEFINDDYLHCMPGAN